MTLSYTISPTYPVPPTGRVATGAREALLRDTFVTFGGRQ